MSRLDAFHQPLSATLIGDEILLTSADGRTSVCLTRVAARATMERLAAVLDDVQQPGSEGLALD